uniref:Neprilysin-like 1 n=2 Tax=Octopus TaxID=6643 RepID=A0A6C0PN53_OCTVU|nr:neprilysin-like 1 [Octopus vulgaris]
MCTGGQVEIKGSNSGCWAGRTTLEKKLFLVLGLSLVLSVAFALTTVVFVLRKDDKEEICLTPRCTVASARLIRSIDTSVNPCDNFFDYTCGQWVKRHAIPDDLSSIDTFTVLRDEVENTLRELLENSVSSSDARAIRKAKLLYKSCMNETLIEERSLAEFETVLRGEFGDWPVRYNSRDINNFSLVNLLSSLRKYNCQPLIHIAVRSNNKNSTSHVLSIDQPSFGMPGQKYYLKGRNDTKLKAYEKLAVQMAINFGADPKTAEEDMSDMVDLEIKLANIITPPENRRDNERLYNKMTVKELSHKFKEFDWMSYFTQVMNIPKKSIYINETEKIIVRDPSYFTELMKILTQVDKRILANYAIWILVKQVGVFLPSRFRKLIQEYDRVMTGIASARPRWSSCTQFTNDHLGNAVGRMFVQQNFDDEAKSQMIEMIRNLQDSFSEILKELEWMDTDTRKVAREKAESMREMIGYPDKILNDTELDRQYKQIDYDPDNFMKNVLETMKGNAIENLKVLRDTVDKDRWITQPAVVNAFYSSTRNSISFPAGILQLPFYDKQQPSSMNYGAIGVVIGHEITHGFDDRGRQFDREGNLRQWWSTDVIKRFTKKADCIENQYSNYSVPEANMKINGRNTLGENIADNGGLKQSFRAYKNWIRKRGAEEPKLPGLNYTHEQLFFLGFAQVWCGNMRPQYAQNRILSGYHSPGRFRVIGTLHNSKEFSEAFNCPKGSYMNPEKKCSVW